MFKCLIKDCAVNHNKIFMYCMNYVPLHKGNDWKLFIRRFIFLIDHSYNSIGNGCKWPSPELERPVKRLLH